MGFRKKPKGLYEILVSMQLFLKKLSRIVNIEDQIRPLFWSSLMWVCTICKFHFVRSFGVIFLGHLPYYLKQYI